MFYRDTRTGVTRIKDDNNSVRCTVLVTAAWNSPAVKLFVLNIKDINKLESVFLSPSKRPEHIVHNLYIAVLLKLQNAVSLKRLIFVSYNCSLYCSFFFLSCSVADAECSGRLSEQEFPLEDDKVQIRPCSRETICTVRPNGELIQMECFFLCVALQSRDLARPPVL